MSSVQARTTRLHFGASSQTRIWWNGQPPGYVSHEKGIGRGALICPVHLQAACNALIIELQRFREHRRLLYASLDDGEWTISNERKRSPLWITSPYAIAIGPL